MRRHFKGATLLVATVIAGVLAISAVIANAESGDPSSVEDSNSVEAVEQRGLEIAKKIEAGEVKPLRESAPEPPLPVLGANGEPIECNGKALIYQSRDAQPSIAYLEGDKGDAVSAPEAVASDSTPSDGGASFAPGCGAEGETSVAWKQFE